MNKKSTNQSSLQVSNELYATIESTEIQVVAGQKQISVTPIHNNKINSASVIPSLDILVGKKTASRLKHLDLNLNYRILSDQNIKIGPIVGVLVSKKAARDYPLPTGRESRIYKEMTLEARQNKIFLYFFYADGVNWSKKTISGHFYAHDEKQKPGWIRAVFPLPDIIYNRIAYRSIERQDKIQAVINKAVVESIYLFNSRFLDKWEVHKTLSLDPLTRKMLPEAIIYTHDNLYYFLDYFETFFIKPIDGSVGKGIIQVKVLSSELITFNKLGDKKGWQECSNADELFKNLGLKGENKYILQKGINLAKIDGNIFDIRAQVQKNGYGKWTFTGAGVRIAAPGNFVTHVPNGGTKASYETVIEKVFGEDSEMIKSLEQQLKTICRTVPRVLEQGLGLSLAVLSMDLGIDANGRIWIIEVNSKPASFDETEIRKRHLYLLNDYLLFISNFVIQ